GVHVLALDAACASALYALGTAVRGLERGECDLAVAGGVFHPGAANACLFAQFGGLSRTGSHPLDARADGVVFSEGTALLALKRLDDALAAGDRIHAVIRGGPRAIGPPRPPAGSPGRATGAAPPSWSRASRARSWPWRAPTRPAASTPP